MYTRMNCKILLQWKMQKNVFSFFLVLLSVAALLDAECNEGGCCFCDADGAVIVYGFQANRCRSNYMCKCGFQRDQGWEGVCSDGDLEDKAFAQHIGHAVYKAKMEDVLNARDEALKTAWKQSIKKTDEVIRESSSLPIESSRTGSSSLPLKSTSIHQNDGKMEKDQSTDNSSLTPPTRGSSSPLKSTVKHPGKMEIDHNSSLTPPSIGSSSPLLMDKDRSADISSLSPTSKDSSSVPVKSTVTQQNYGQSADISLPLRSSLMHQNNGKMEIDQSTDISPLTPEARGSSSHSLQSIAIQRNPVKIEKDQKANIPSSSFSKGSSSLPLMSTVPLHPGKIEISSLSPPKGSSSLPLMSTVPLHPGKIEISSVSPPKGSSSLPLETTQTQQNPGKMEKDTSADISSLSPKESSSLPVMSIVTQQNHDKISDISSMSSRSNKGSSSLPFKSTLIRQNHGKIQTDPSAVVSSRSPPSRGASLPGSSLPLKSTMTLQNRGKMVEKVLRTHLPLVLPPSLGSSSVPQKSTITQQNPSKMEKDLTADIPSLSPPSKGNPLHWFSLSKGSSSPPVDSAETRKNPLSVDSAETRKNPLSVDSTETRKNPLPVDSTETRKNPLPARKNRLPIDSTETRKNPEKMEKIFADISSQSSPLNEKARRPSLASNFRLKNKDEDPGSREEAVERVTMQSTGKESGCRTCYMVHNSRLKTEDEDQSSKEEAVERAKESVCKSCSKVVQNPPISLQNSGDFSRTAGNSASTKSGKSTEKDGGCKSCLVVRNSDEKNKLENYFQKARRNCAYLPKQLCCQANENCGKNYDCFWYCCNGDCGTSYIIL